MNYLPIILFLFYFTSCSDLEVFLKANNQANQSSSSISSQDPLLVAYWKFDETSGTNILDSSVNSNNGLLTNGGSHVTGKYGNGLELNGSNQFVMLGNKVGPDLNGAQAISISVWYNLYSSTNGWGNFIFSTRLNPGVEGAQIYTYDQVLYIQVRSSSSESYYSRWLPFTATNNEWHHLVGVYDFVNSNILIYFDKILTVSNDYTFSNTFYTYGSPIEPDTIGVDSTFSPVCYFHGILDELRIYKKVLTQTEVNLIYAGN